jgi:hypothetical protein
MGRSDVGCPRDLTLQNLELFAEHEDLEILRPVGAAAQNEQIDHESDKTVETGHLPILIDADHTVQTDTRNPRSTPTTVFPAPTGSNGLRNHHGSLLLRSRRDGTLFRGRFLRRTPGRSGYHA